MASRTSAPPTSGFRELTLDALKAATPHSIFASGYGLMEHPWFNDATRTVLRDGRSTEVRWVAVRGGIQDWAIYHSLTANFIRADYLDDPAHLEVSEERIAMHGAKVHDEKLVRAWVPCTDEAFAWYRH